MVFPLILQLGDAIDMFMLPFDERTKSCKLINVNETNLQIQTNTVKEMHTLSKIAF